MTSDDFENCSIFDLTNWTLLGSLNTASDEQIRAVLENLLATYLPALKTHLTVRRRMTSENADDLLQDFTVHCVIENRLFQRADRTRGRFRQLLVRALDNFSRDRFRRSQAKGRSPDGVEDWKNVESQLADDPLGDTLEADREWACLVLKQTLERMWGLSQTDNGRRNWNTFCYRLLLPLVMGQPQLNYSQIANREGFGSFEQAQNSLISAKRLFQRCLRSVVARYSDEESDIQADLGNLMSALAGNQHKPKSIFTPSLLAALPEACQHTSETPSHDGLSRLFLVEDRPASDWDQRETSDILSQVLQTPLCRLIPKDFPSDIPDVWRQTSAQQLFEHPAPDLAALSACKRFGKRWIENKHSVLPPEIGAYFYFVAIALARIKLQQDITTSDLARIRRGLQKLSASITPTTPFARIVQDSLSGLAEL